MANLRKFESEIRRTPLWQLKNQIRQATLELELLKKDPSASHNEIAELDAKLTGWKLEYARRVATLKVGLG
ncbi:MAG: hypothetical protein PWR10_1806 [Halanaerobiales bacterium]|nr:hypothetical protein [Halanaerobiales bacterium]